MDPVLLSFSFLAGIQAFFAPCCIVLIPAYASYSLKENEKEGNKRKQIFNGLRLGIFAGLGLITVYVIFGLLIAFFGRLLIPVFPWIELITGFFLIFLGTSILFGYQFAVKLPFHIKVKSHGNKRFYFFGITYALGAIGCTLPIFLLVIFQSLAQSGPVSGLINFLAYGLAMIGMMMIFSIITALSKTAIRSFLSKYIAVIQKSSAFFIIIAGIYLIYLAFQVIKI